MGLEPLMSGRRLYGYALHQGPFSLMMRVLRAPERLQDRVADVCKIEGHQNVTILLTTRGKHERLGQTTLRHAWLGTRKIFNKWVVVPRALLPTGACKCRSMLVRWSSLMDGCNFFLRKTTMQVHMPPKQPMLTPNPNSI